MTACFGRCAQTKPWSPSAMRLLPRFTAVITVFLVAGCGAGPRQAGYRTVSRAAPAPGLRLADNPIARIEIIRGMRRDPLRFCRRRFVSEQRILQSSRRLLVGIRGRSMAPSLREGDLVMTIRPDRAPQPGDIIVFSSPDGRNRLIIKRVVARPGRTVALSRGLLRINGESVAQSPPIAWRTHELASMCRRGVAGPAAVRQNRLANGRAFPVLACGGPRIAPRDFDEVRVPYRHVFVMGDNRDRSIDSRVFGPIPHDSIVGIAACVADRS
jgi:signal peptidase I